MMRKWGVWCRKKKWFSSGQGSGPLQKCFAPNFQLFACILTHSQRPLTIRKICTVLRPHLWEYPFTPYLYLWLERFQGLFLSNWLNLSGRTFININTNGLFVRFNWYMKWIGWLVVGFQQILHWIWPKWSENEEFDVGKRNDFRPAREVGHSRNVLRPTVTPRISSFLPASWHTLSVR